MVTENIYIMAERISNTVIKMNWIKSLKSKVKNVKCIFCQEYEAQISCKNANESCIRDSKNPTSEGVRNEPTRCRFGFQKGTLDPSNNLKTFLKIHHQEINYCN